MDRCSPELCSTCPEQIICRCLDVSENSVVEAIVRHGFRSIRELKRHTGAGDGCTCCHGQLQEILNRVALDVVQV